MHSSHAICIKTSKYFNHAGLALMWVAMALLIAALLLPTGIFSFIVFAAFVPVWAVFLVAEKRGLLFDYVVVKPNNFARMLIGAIGFLVLFGVLGYLAFSNNIDNVVVATAIAAVGCCATAFRFVGIQK